MAANLFAHRWPQAQVDVIESSEVGIVGVGEGSTPQLKAFFDRLGVAEAEWMPACNATYKAGISFHGWSERPGFDRYFHPFATELDVHTAPRFFRHTLACRERMQVHAHPDRFFLSARLAAERLAPLAPEHFPFEIGYGYHFDAYLVGAFLREHAKRRGVRHHDRRVVEVEVADGEVAALRFEGGERVAGDLFVDASGFRAVIASALGVPFRSFGENLFNDSAVVMPTPSEVDGPASETRSTALRNGWAWAIPLTNRIGNGYVYSSRYCSAEEAEAELRSHLGVGDDVPARRLSMRVGQVETSWTGNCLAIGLAQGFIEPLEATALHLVQATVEGFMSAWEAGGFGPKHRDAFNRTIAARYEGVRDYIVCHYRVNRRTDTPYWRDNAVNDSLSDSLKGVLTAWFRRRDLEAEIERQDIARYYAPLSWHCLLAGYGVYPPADKLHPPEDAARYDMTEVDEYVRRAALNFRPHGEALAALSG